MLLEMHVLFCTELPMNFLFHRAARKLLPVLVALTTSLKLNIIVPRDFVISDAGSISKHVFPGNSITVIRFQTANWLSSTKGTLS
jgi:hypothetical protein